MFKFNQANIIYSPKVIGGLLQAPTTVHRAGIVIFPIKIRPIDRRSASTNALSTGRAILKVITSALGSSLPAQPKKAPILERSPAPQDTDLRFQYQQSIEDMTANESTIHTLYERRTGTWQYVVSDPSTKAAVIIDPVLDYEPTTQTITTNTADSILSLIKDQGLRVERVLETHVHADHITAASYLQNKLSQSQGH
ncbi:hypothetical protein KCU98_g420, partial [Aureobasidium melanogenum]